MNINLTTKLSIAFLIFALFFYSLRVTMLTEIHRGTHGVRQSNLSGMQEKDHSAGYMLDVPFIHTIYKVPTSYRYQDYKNLSFRTSDNNQLRIDVGFFYRVREGHGHKIVSDGLLQAGNGQTYKFDDLARQGGMEALLSELANGKLEDFYNTAVRRDKLAAGATKVLNTTLEAWNLETSGILIRHVQFPQENENQLAQIQLNEQRKKLDGVKATVAKKQQKLDNFNNGTKALVQASRFDWTRKVSDLERAYKVGIVDSKGDNSPGAVRRALKALSEDDRAKLREIAALALGIDVEKVTTPHLLGISNIHAETREYKARVEAEATGTEARLIAEGERKKAEIQGNYETSLNKLLSSPGGRGYVAFNAAQHITFAPSLTFQSSDGVPYPWRLEEFATHLMGK